MGPLRGGGYLSAAQTWSSNEAIASSPVTAATCKGVPPSSLSAMAVEAPACKRLSTTSRRDIETAACKAPAPQDGSSRGPWSRGMLSYLAKVMKAAFKAATAKDETVRSNFRGKGMGKISV